MPANELKQQAKTLGIGLLFDPNFWSMGPCVIATFPTHNGGGCDSALAWTKNFSSRDDAESYALKIAIRNASPGDSDREVERE
ncbi:hypothetical protein [Serratia nevei]|uniref:hypothetical protein n=1 Tax=Serratia nevei TaxID=2703794 RepID=UPI003FA6AFB1|nr:hypothetical protein [Serratia marcescens]